MVQAHLSITGSVIGVGFRSWTKRHASAHDVTGWIRNVDSQPKIFGPLGGVEAVLQGKKPDVEAMIELIKKGPPSSQVDEVVVVWEKPHGEFTFFEVRF